MNGAEAMYLLGALHDDVQAGQGSMTIPMEIVEALLGMWEQQETEYGHEVAQGTIGPEMSLRTEQDIYRRLYSLSQWIGKYQEKGVPVCRRRVIVVESWEELIKGAIS